MFKYEVGCLKLEKKTGEWTSVVQKIVLSFLKVIRVLTRTFKLGVKCWVDWYVYT